MNGLTDRQREALLFIKTYKDTHGYAPTLREIGARMGIRSTNGVNDHLRALERKGVISRTDLLARSITISGEMDRVVARTDGEQIHDSAMVVTLRQACEAAKKLFETEAGVVTLGGERLRVYNMLARALVGASAPEEN